MITKKINMVNEILHILNPSRVETEIVQNNIPNQVLFDSLTQGLQDMIDFMYTRHNSGGSRIPPPPQVAAPTPRRGELVRFANV